MQKVYTFQELGPNSHTHSILRSREWLMAAPSTLSVRAACEGEEEEEEEEETGSKLKLLSRPGLGRGRKSLS